MTSIKPKWMAILLVILMYSPIHAEVEKSRITQILSLTQKNNEGSSLKEQSELFIQDLRKRLPNFSEEQLKVMQDAYEDALLEGKTAPLTKTEEVETHIDEPEKKEPLKENTITQKIRQHIEESKGTTPIEKTMPVNSDEIAKLKKAAEQTIILLTVEKGDTLSDIAKRNYQDASMYIAIYEENKDQLKSPNNIPEGVILKVPTIDNSNKEKFHKMVLEYEKKHKK